MADDEKEANEPDYKTLMGMLEGEFTDEGFPPDERSILTRESVFGLDKEEEKALKGLEYVRLKEVYKSNRFKLFDTISPNGIKQGCLCNAYFLSAISALAEHPEYIKKCFVSETVNSFGCYAVELFLNGEKTELIIDDKIPVYAGTKDVAFSSSTSNDIWVQLLEKAWAKANGGYDKTLFGLASEVLRAITGAPTFAYDHDDVKLDDIYKQLKKSTLNGYTILCSIDSDSYEGEEYVSNFSYNVLGVYKVKTTKGNAQIVKIRNNWGNFEWEGDWSPDSKLWTKSIKDEIDWEDGENGVLYMSLEDYHQNFATTIICKINPAYHHSTMEVRQDIGSESILKFSLLSDQTAFFTLSQLAFRIVPKEYNYHPYNAKMILVRSDKENKEFPLEYIDAIVDSKDDISIEADLVAGEYYLFVEVDWDDVRPHDS